MSSASPLELSASAVISMIESGAYGRDVVLTVARGFLPLEEQDLVAVLAYLSTTSDQEIASLARTSLSEVPPRILQTFAANPDVAPEHLDRLSRVVTDRQLLEALIRNRALPDVAVADLARRADPAVQDVVVINQERILRAPEILDALLENPSLSADVRRRALETREEFFEKKARLQQDAELLALQEPDLIDAPLDAITDLLERADQTPPAEPVESPLTEAEKLDPNKVAIWAKLQFMSISEKVQLAFKGDRTVRMLLVRDRNKLICTAAIRNPRITEQEVENIAGMRNVEEEILRIIASRRDWMGRYNVMLTLCRNPKAPVGVVLPLINRLTLRDLKGLKEDKGVPQVVRENAKRLYLTRTQKTGP